MVGENKRDQCVFPNGVEKGLPSIAVADDHLEKMNALGGEDDKVDRRRKQATAEVVKVSDKDQETQKKRRFIWTRDVHNCFLDAIKQLGFNRAVPTKILELMNVEDLTRENVASHLQKYRLQVKRRDQERAQARTASENVPKGVYPHLNGSPQQPWVLPNTMQGINMDCAFLDGSQLAPSFANHNLNMIQAFPTVQEVYGAPFKDLLDEGVNRMSSVRLVHGLYDSNGPHDVNKIGYNYGPLPQKPLVDFYAHNLMDRHDTTLIPQYDRQDELSLQGIISPFVPQYDRRDELSLQGIISPSFVRDELFVADQGIVSPLLAQNMEGLGVGVLPLPEAIGGLIGMKAEGIEVGMPHLPTGVLGMKVEGLGLGVQRLPEAVGGLAGMKFKGHVPRLPEATGGLAGMKIEGHVPHLPETTGGLTGMKAEGLGVGVTHLPEATGGPRLGVPQPPEATGGFAGMNDFQQVLSSDEEQESALDFIDFCMNTKGVLDGKSFDDLFWR